MIQAIFFDQDNTLVNTREVAPEVYRMAIENGEEWQKWLKVVEKVRWSKNPKDRTFEYSLQQVIDDKERVLEIIKKERDELGKVIKLKPGVEKFFKNKIKNIKYILATEDFDNQIDIKLAKFGMRNKFDLITTSGDVGVMKPDLGYFRPAWEKFGLDQRKCLYVGDDYEKDCRLGVETGGKAVVFGKDIQDMGKLFGFINEKEWFQEEFESHWG
ncbi:hypothetical protein COS78_02715 [Candidatus Shapirobacteria bacterium CG06_land_8_20_14_3_00_40_12]|uniref:HAD family hydrolase n=2 Tax=Candidatus Shapironibacteriota TaxID=1752721 RepID=A0A2M7TSU0_9BACT|nr:MAG: hypothetical protein COS78_02715 [Candidatus Shapirobacteria bacterium CG06_land_8_20_14_3_00_40_12]PIZ58872.1 MAG: hypothetical protein COY20_02755 [Candidatus Shapirobacteria bacterium CG_4_10_14_0_2_um_filter_40_12]